ncbi:hypothetical protein QT381_06675 [Galbitalea sp. SE-J8]|nr:hypothetical protein [Galbitalea sp. SE-J8]MDM4762688.1 hypothetical protein [Galbitalea sp. SE-J8]
MHGLELELRFPGEGGLAWRAVLLDLDAVPEASLRTLLRAR